MSCGGLPDDVCMASLPWFSLVPFPLVGNFRGGIQNINRAIIQWPRLYTYIDKLKWENI